MAPDFNGYQDGMLFMREGNTVHPINIRVCLRCGSVVADEEKHDIWHGTLDSRTQ